MKKITKTLLLSLAALTGLVGCGGAPEVDKDVAKQRAQKIVEKQNEADFEIPNKLYIELNASSTSVSKSGDETEKTDMKHYQIMSLDLNAQQLYVGASTSTSTNGQDPDNGCEYLWVYVEDNYIYTVYQKNDTKQYTKEAFSGSFKDTIEANYQTLETIIKSSDALDLDEYEKEVYDDIASQIGLSFGKPTVKYTSNGEGNLGIEQTASLDVNLTKSSATIKATGSITSSIGFDNYLYSFGSSSVKLSVDLNGTVHMDVNASSKLNVHLNKAKFSKPNLNDFSQMA